MTEANRSRDAVFAKATSSRWVYLPTGVSAQTARPMVEEAAALLPHRFHARPSNGP